MSSSNAKGTAVQSDVQTPLSKAMLDRPKGSSYEPCARPLSPSVSGPVPAIPLEPPRARSARTKLTAGAFAGCAIGVGVGRTEGVVTGGSVEMGDGDAAVASGRVAGAGTHAPRTAAMMTAVANRGALLIGVARQA